MSAVLMKVFSLSAKTEGLQERLKYSIARFREHLENVHAQEYSTHEEEYGRRVIKAREGLYL